MSKIRILLSVPKNANPDNYINALNNAGAEAVPMYLPDVDTDYDGLLLTGGSDVNPGRYNEEIDGSIGIDIDRDAAEFAVLKAFVDVGKPIMGICRGHQITNVFFGGSLYQHLPESDLHRGDKIIHEVTALENSIVGRLYGTSFLVNSTHHQAVKKLGEGLRATAFWKNKYVEAYEHTTLPVFGVQWHPERLCNGQNGEKVFEYFVKLCNQYKK